MWQTSLVALWHVGSSRTRDRTRVPCTGRLILNHCATREVPHIIILLTSLQAPSGAKIHHYHREKSDRILIPTWQIDIIAVNSVTPLIMGLTIITEKTEMISSIKTGITMAGAMTMITEEW